MYSAEVSDGLAFVCRGLTLQVGLVRLFGNTLHLLIPELVGQIKNRLGSPTLFSAIVCVFTLRRWIGTLKLEVLGALLDHLAVHLPETIPSIDDLGGVRDNLVTGEEILRQLSAYSQRGGASPSQPSHRITYPIDYHFESESR
jgi:hypothetical protein